MAQLKVSIVGAGIGYEHYKHYAKLKNLFNVISICDKNSARLEKLKQRVSNVELVTDYLEILQNSAVDIVDICLPPHMHFEATKQAIEHGKHVICEKPLALSLKEIDCLQSVVSKSSYRIFPIFQYRFGAGFSALLRVMRANIAGECVSATLETHWDRKSDYYRKKPSNLKQYAGGGAVVEQGIHIHDMMLYALGNVARVSAKLSSHSTEIDVEDNSAIIFEMERGALITSSITLAGAGNVSRLKLFFENLTVESSGNAYSPASGPWTFIARDPRQQEKLDKIISEGTPSYEEGFSGLFMEIHKALMDEDNTAATVLEARKAVELTTAIYASAIDNTWVEIPVSKESAYYSGW